AKGVAFLKRSQLASGSWNDWGHNVGYAALPGLTLLECGVPAKDEAVQKAAKYIRDKAPKHNQTYDISLAILFLDRLGDPQDKALIKSLALRLVAGQTAKGGWGYNCQPLDSTDEKKLYDLLVLTRPKKAMNRLNPEPEFIELKDVDALPARVQQVAVFKDQPN